MKTTNTQIKRLEKTKTELEKINTENLKDIDKLNTTTTSLFNISLTILTIQLTILSGTIYNIFQQYYPTHKTLTITTITLLLIDITSNIYSILQFKLSLNMSKGKHKNEEIIIRYAENKIRNTVYLKLSIDDYIKSLKHNYRIINLKSEYINKGLKYILISIIFLIITMIMIFIIPTINMGVI